MTFYVGLVAKLIPINDENTYQIVEIQNINTSDDANMHINFSHGNIIRAVFIPVSEIEGFVNGKTTTLSRDFDVDLGLEIWKSVQ